MMYWNVRDFPTYTNNTVHKCLSIVLSSEWVGQLEAMVALKAYSYYTEPHCMTPGDFSTPQITLHNMCGGFQLEGDDWNNTTCLTPSCGVKQQAA